MGNLIRVSRWKAWKMRSVVCVKSLGLISGAKEFLRSFLKETTTRRKGKNKDNKDSECKGVTRRKLQNYVERKKKEGRNL